MIRANTSSHEGIEIGTSQSTCMTANRFTASQPRLNDIAHALLSLNNAAHIHHFGYTTYFRHGQHFFKFSPPEISARQFQSRGRRYTRRCQNHETQGQICRGLNCPFHSVNAMNIAQLMGIPDNGCDTPCQYGFRIVTGRDHGTFHMHVGIY